MRESNENKKAEKNYYLNENNLNVFEQNINLKDFLKTKNVFQKNLKSKSTNSLTSNKEKTNNKTKQDKSHNNDGKKCTMITTVEFFPNEENIINEFDVANEDVEKEKLKEDIKKLKAYEKLIDEQDNEIKSLKLEDILIKDLGQYRQRLNKLRQKNIQTINIDEKKELDKKSIEKNDFINEINNKKLLVNIYLKIFKLVKHILYYKEKLILKKYKKKIIKR